MISRPLVIIESPFAANASQTEASHALYLRRALRDSIINRGEVAFASHALYPFALRESEPLEREMGIRLGYEFWPFASLIAFYMDYGWSKGMESANYRAEDLGFKYEFRCIGKNEEE